MTLARLTLAALILCVATPAFAALFDRAFHLIREEVMTSMAQQAAALSAA